MRFISTKTHGALDYLMGIILILAPWILGFANGGAAQWVPIIIGGGMILYSIITDYELGMAKMIPMSAHLMIDLVAGIFLAISPWLFGFSELIFWPHLVFGILEIGAALTTEKTPSYRTTTN